MVEHNIKLCCNSVVPQSLALVLVHIVFSTKNRAAFLQVPDLQSEVHAYLTATLRGLECEPLRVGGAKDQEEFRAILEKHGIAFDERYVWD